MGTLVFRCIHFHAKIYWPQFRDFSVLEWEARRLLLLKTFPARWSMQLAFKTKQKRKGISPQYSQTTLIPLFLVLSEFARVLVDLQIQEHKTSSLTLQAQFSFSTQHSFAPVTWAIFFQFTYCPNKSRTIFVFIVLVNVSSF